MALLIRNIQGLAQVRDAVPGPLSGTDLQQLPVLENAYLYLSDGKIADFGPMPECPEPDAEVIDATGRWVFPSYVDAHSHLVFAASREGEFVMRLKGKSYEEIAAEGGGILNSAKRLQETPEDELLQGARQRLDEVIRKGTGALEIKSGYGLTYEAELKMLRVIRQLRAESPIPIKATFLGAHAIPMAYRQNREAYIAEVKDQMLPAVAREGLAQYMDVFCERGFFSQDETEQLLAAGRSYGLKPKVHANELGYTGGVQAGVNQQAVSVDHLECTGEEEIEALKGSRTIPVLLPSTAFFLDIAPPPARQMADAGLPVALSTDYNPGSCPSGNMPFTTALGCVKLKLLPEESLNAATVNAAHAIELGETHGHISRGAAANVFITDEVPSYTFLPYSFGNDHIKEVIVNGKRYRGLT